MDVEFFAITSFLSVLAGTGSYLNSVRKKGGWSWFGLLAENILSLSVGLSVGYFSLSMELEKDLTFFLIIVAANNSDDAITVTKNAVSSLIEKRFGIKLKKED